MKQEKDAVRIVGLSIMTQEATAPTDIGALWQKAGANGVLSQTAPNYGVYTDYEDGRRGSYRVVVGAESERAPQGDEVVVEIPAGSYRVLKDEGPVPAVVTKAWQKVWAEWEKERTYQLDFERYIGSPESSQFELCIGVK